MSAETRPSYAHLAAEWDCHKGTARVWAIKLGIAELPAVSVRGITYPGKQTRDVIEARNARIVELRAGGMKHLDIAAAIGCSRATVENALRARRRRGVI